MSSAVIYQIGRFGITSTAGLYQPGGTFLQVFPCRRVYRDKSTWVAAWYIFGDETITMYLRPPKATILKSNS